MKKILSLTLACVMTLGLLTACGSSEQPSSGGEGGVAAQDLVMGTGSTGGTYFALGGAMANAMNDKMTDIGVTVTAQSTGASVENINLINAGEMDLGIAMNNVAAAAEEYGFGNNFEKAANVAGFMKVAEAMKAQGCC